MFAMPVAKTSRFVCAARCEIEREGIAADRLGQPEGRVAEASTFWASSPACGRRKPVEPGPDAEASEAGGVAGGHRFSSGRVLYRARRSYVGRATRGISMNRARLAVLVALATLGVRLRRPRGRRPATPARDGAWPASTTRACAPRPSEPASWLTYGGTYAEQRYSPLAQIDETNVAHARPRLRLRDEHHARPRGDAARRRRRDLHDRLLERRLRGRRAHRPAALEPRPGGAAPLRRARLLRRREPRRRALPGPRLRRHARRPAPGARRGDRRAGLVGGHRGPDASRTRSRWRRAW